jgi:glutathione S-transferase
MKLFGTITSPFVRRVRIVAAETGEPVELVDTATAAGQAALLAVSPIGKVPVASIDGRVLFDSHVIIDWLLTTRGWNGLQPPRDAWRTQNLVNAIDGALGAIIEVFYLRRDGIAIEGTGHLQHRFDRADRVFSWLAGELAPGGESFEGGLGLPEIALITTLDWMDFRKPFPTERTAPLGTLRAAWRERPSLVATMPR